ncbi:hypothetical protein CIHG_00710 [Coccidioides immitis H538.4]|uniref:Uncharacterized protein n=2 Tax=Coccidioides immitis TaxID=5501 RepID=A0A0J8U7C5_COCIT|nr:hypothetical protein CIRG_03130 [Coccidioides immitis RMSCC 2394]KMU82928.1 hypothetical protein CIHG_00710 [Coccidioides immitis H538.4]
MSIAQGDDNIAGRRSTGAHITANAVSSSVFNGWRRSTLVSGRGRSQVPVLMHAGRKIASAEQPLEACREEEDEEDDAKRGCEFVYVTNQLAQRNAGLYSVLHQDNKSQYIWGPSMPASGFDVKIWILETLVSEN